MDRELLITAPEVVDSEMAFYPGPWSFGHLMEEAFGKSEAPTVVLRWLEEWASGRPAAAEDPALVTARPGVTSKIIESWKRADGYQVGPLAWSPRLENAPFRLLAIVNRMDLGRVPVEEAVRPAFGPWGGGSDSDVESLMGEGRLVFCTVDAQGRPLEGGLTVIFEYGLQGTTDQHRIDWALAWHQLGEMGDLDATYRASLAKVTRLFTDRVDADANHALGNGDRPRSPVERIPRKETTQLMRVRTNDGALGKIWEFREWHPDEEGFLKPAVLAGSPGEEFFERGSKPNRMLTRWLKREVSEIRTNPDPELRELPDAFELPHSFSANGESWKTATLVAVVPDNDAEAHWDGWGLSDSEVRRTLSMQTCCGCHCGDTGSVFFHVAPRKEGEPADLSPFLRTDGSRLRIRDPATGRGFVSTAMEDRVEMFRSFLSPDLRSSEIREMQVSRRLRVH
ncbi:lipoprotein [Haloferula helveola]|uniref:Lipoprotein n=2 Tax=Haloferula helveola TaxID=490095 RepID=A0ABN6HBC8_9BACT|nr:lipoprotein [Haloferula helveola]